MRKFIICSVAFVVSIQSIAAQYQQQQQQQQQQQSDYYSQSIVFKDQQVYDPPSKNPQYYPEPTVAAAVPPPFSASQYPVEQQYAAAPQYSVASENVQKVPTIQATQQRVEPIGQNTQAPLSQEAIDAVNQFYPPVDRIQNPDVDAISLGNEKFALSFFKKMGEMVPNNDFMISPFSVWALLASAAEGATGTTLQEFQNILNLRDISRLAPVFNEIRSKLVIKTDTVDLTVFQAIFHNKSLTIGSDYRRKLQDSYHTEIYPLEGNKIKEQILNVNGIIRNATMGYHQAVFQAQDLDTTSLLLLSLIHFRGQWRFPFNNTYTRDEPFYDEQGQPVGQVKMMFQRIFVPYAPIQKLESHIVDLPYGDQNRLRMLVILPRKNVSLLQVLDKLSTITIQEIFEQLRKSVQQFEDEEIEVHLPKFNTTSDFNLNGVLQEMGMTEALNVGARFDKINSNIYLSRVTHKSKIMVDEEGTVASSITAGLFANKSSGPRFYANRPFLYLIVDRVTRLVLFCGQMKNNPVSSGRESRKQ